LDRTEKAFKNDTTSNRPGANPTIASYSASVVFFYIVKGSKACFENKNILFYFENALAYYNNAGVAAVNSKIV
jgi:hypothetical protein